MDPIGWNEERERRSTLLPEWKSSDGVFEEKQPDGEQHFSEYGRDGHRSVSEYQPRKLLEFSSSYGALTAGLDQRQALIFILTQKRRRTLRTLPQISRAIEPLSIQRFGLQSGQFFSNSGADQAQGAILYRSDMNHDRDEMLHRMTKMMQQHPDRRLPQTLLPYLNSGAESQELENWREYKRTMSPLGEKVLGAAGHRRAQFLEAEIVRKYQQKQRLIRYMDHALQSAREEQKKNKTSAINGHWLLAVLRPSRLAEELKLGAGADALDDEVLGGADENKSNPNQTSSYKTNNADISTKKTDKTQI